MILTPDTKSGRYISILADGKFHETVDQNTEGAVLREYETSDKKKGSKWELVYSKLDGTITGLEFQDGDYGKNLQITFTDGDDEVILSQGTATNFGEDLLKKLPNVDFAANVSVQPYSFTSDEGKPVRGVNLYQNDVKLTGFFWDFEAKKPKNGYPEIDFDKETADSDDWKAFYIKARKFMIAYATEHLLPKFEKSVSPAKDDFAYPAAEEEINPEDIPFE